MSLNRYFSELTQNLKHLSDAECNEAVAFYEEYASEAGIDTYEAMVSRFGSPRKLAAAIYAETASKEIENSSERESGSVSRGFWIGMAALAAFPFSLSAILVIVCIGFALLVSLGSILLSFAVAAFAIAAAGIWSLFRCFTFLVPFSAGAFLMSLGSFLVLTPVGCILLVLFCKLMKKLMTAIVVSVTNYIHRRTNHEA